MKPSDSVRTFAEERVEKISRLVDRGGEAQVVISKEKHLNVAHVELLIDGSLRMRGVDKSEDLYGAIDAAVDRIIRQVKRYRDKIRSHRETQPTRELPQRVIAVEDEDEKPQAPQLVRQETTTAQMMSLDDALMQLDLLNSEFLVFIDRDSARVNILHRLPSGDLGLIDVQAPN